MFDAFRAAILLTLALLCACALQERKTTTEVSSTGDASASTVSTGEASTGTTAVSQGSSTYDDSTDSLGDPCDSTCGPMVECYRPDVSEPPDEYKCMPGYHCVESSYCGCEFNYCMGNCDPEDPKACPMGGICDIDTGECVQP